MEIKTVCALEEKELNAMRTIANIDCTGLDCRECPLYMRKENKCVRSFLRLILSDNNVDYMEGGE